MLMSQANNPHACFWPPKADPECPHAVQADHTTLGTKLQAERQELRLIPDCHLSAD